MGLLTAKTGAEDLRAWLASRAKLADQVMQPEEALLGGRFVRYAARRLFAFSLARAWTIVLHVVELTWLAEVFTAKTFVASIALQNVTLVIDAAYWGALEAMRRRVRALGPSSEAAALVTRWLTVSIGAGAAIALVPLARAVYGAIADDRVPSMLHVYALVCALRLGADVVIRTYYSGVYAHRRVHRPVWSVFAPPLVLVAVTFATWNAAGGWSFPIALVASAIVSRGLLFGFTRRAYRVQRVPSPRVRLLPRLAIPDLSTVKDAVLGAVANLTTRLGAVVLLAAVIPSLSGVDDDPLAPFAFALHLAAPALSLSAQWGLLFYHDHKRLEDEPSHALAHALHVRLLACGAVLGVFAWAATCGITAWFVPLAEVWPTLAALLPATVGLSIWTGLQIRGFARGDFATQAISAATMLLALWGALSAEWTGPVAWYLALGASPWVAIALHVMLARFFARRGEVA
ncbi:MAG TPA: hypothetical protein VIF62_15870, partial [Labilithrix sp.]